MIQWLKDYWHYEPYGSEGYKVFSKGWFCLIFWVGVIVGAVFLLTLVLGNATEAILGIAIVAFILAASCK